MPHPVIIASPKALFISAKASSFPRFNSLNPIGPAAKALASIEVLPLCETERVQA